MKKKITFLTVLLSLVCSLSMTSCIAVDAYKDQKNCDKETKQLLEDNKQPFIDKVKSIYGNDAELTDIKPMTFLATDLLYSVTKSDGNLTGTLTLNGKKYEVDYNTETDTIRDSVNTEAICLPLVEALPIDQNKITELHYVDFSDYFRYKKERVLKYSPETKTLDDLINNTVKEDEYTPIDIFVFTTEQFDDISLDELKKADVFRKFDNCHHVMEISVVSLKDEEKFSELKEMMLRSSNLISQYSNPDTTEDQKTEFFEKYHIVRASVIKNILSRTEDDETVNELKVFNI